MKPERQELFEEWLYMTNLFKEAGSVLQNPGAIPACEVQFFEDVMNIWIGKLHILVDRTKTHLLSGKEQ